MIKFDKVQQLIEREKLDALLVMFSYKRRYLISDFRYKAQGAEQAEAFEFVLQQGSLLDFITSFMESKNIKRIGFEGEHVNYNTYSKIKDDFEVVPLTGEVEKIRLIKTE